MPASVVFSGVAWTTPPADPVRVTAWTRPSSMAILRQVSPVRVFGDADRERRQPVQQHMRAGPWFETVEHRPQLEGGLEVPEASFGLQQVLVAQGDVLGAQVGVAA